ncbi:Hsp20/alpha crystallin family protein [Caulobacter sp. LARHSG274]
MADPHSETVSKPSAAPPPRRAEPSPSPAAEPASFRPDDGGRQAREGDIALTQEGGELAAAARQTTLASIRLWEQALEPFNQVLSGMARLSQAFWRDAASGLRAPQVSRLLTPAPFLDLPSVDVKETADACVVSVELPGLTEQDIKVSAEDGLLRIQGRKAQEQDAATSTYRRSERWFGQFERSFPLPPGVAPERMTTAMRHGVLEIVLPKAAPTENAPAGAVRH